MIFRKRSFRAKPNRYSNLVGFAPGHQAVAAEAGIGTQDDPGLRPRLPNLPDNAFDLLERARAGIQVGGP